MPDNRNRKRPIQVKFFVDEKELSLIKARRMVKSAHFISPILKMNLYNICSYFQTFRYLNLYFL